MSASDCRFAGPPRPPRGNPFVIVELALVGFTIALFILWMLDNLSFAFGDEPPRWVTVEKFEIKECTGQGCRQVPCEWRIASNDPRCVYLFRDGLQAGAWYRAERQWRDYDPIHAAWSDAKSAGPYPPPEKLPVSFGETTANHGVNLEALSKYCDRAHGEHTFSVNGRDCCRRSAFEALAHGGIPNDADCLRLTFVGSAEEAAKLRKVLAGLPDWKDKVTLQDYRSADDPMLKDLGFVSGLHVQSPAGLPLWYCADVPGPAELAEGLDLGGLRRRDPKWDPRLWPPLHDKHDKPRLLDWSRDLSAATDWLKRNWLIPVAALGAYAVWRRRPRPNASVK